jgi:hypothetical protein
MRVRAILLLATMVLVGMLLSGVALAAPKGTPGPDTLNGNKKPNKFHGKGGNDLIHGKGSSDELHGDDNDDELHGGRGGDYIFGGRGVDLAYGGQGGDWFSTDTETHKQLNPTAAADQLNGGLGDDTFVTVDDDPDIVNCGPGNDRAWIDEELDEAQTPPQGDCERVVFCPDGQPEQCPGGAPPRPPQQDRSSRFSL